MNDKTCICIVVSNLEYGGAQRQIVELFNHIDKSKYEMHICSLSDYVPLSKKLKDGDGRLHVVEKRWKYDVSVSIRLAKLLKAMKARIVISYLFDADIAARLAGKMVGIKVVNSERNAYYNLKRIKRITYFMTKFLNDKWIANSFSGARYNQSVLGHSEDQYEVIHNGVDTQLFVPRDKHAAKKRIGIDPDVKVIGMFASFKEQKNQPMLLEAFRRAMDQMPDTVLLFVGDQLYKGMHGSDGYTANIKKMIVDLGLSEHCLIIGNQDDVAAVYPACDCTVLPSKFEGTPNVVLESMACGVPVIATRVSDNGKLIEDGLVGHLVELNDVEDLSRKLVRMITDDENRETMGNAARQWVVDNFSSKVLARKTEEAIDRILKTAN